MPPPKATTSGAKMELRETMPVQSSCTYWANTACAAALPLRARAIRSAGDSPPAMRINAVAEAYCSKQPHWPQGQGRPSLWVMICPSSGASPVGLRQHCPLMTMPPPMPVPRVSRIPVCTFCSAPERISANIAAWPSLMTTAGRLDARRSNAARGTSTHARLSAVMVSRAAFSVPGAPAPIAAT